MEGVQMQYDIKRIPNKCNINEGNLKNKLGLSCAKLSLASAKLHTSSDQLKLATN